MRMINRLSHAPSVNVVAFVLTISVLSGCGGADSTSADAAVIVPPVATTPEPPPAETEPEPEDPAPSETDNALRALIDESNIVPINVEELGAPSVQSDLAQLGKQLFFAKNLGGESSVACVSCHHPMLGGADALSLSVGVNAVNQFDQQSHDLLGNGRFNGAHVDNLPVVPRNAPTVFNMAMNDQAVFWDGRIERRADGQILTPDSIVNAQGRRLVDENLPDGISLADAQARFPVTSNAEMRGDFSSDSDNQTLRDLLAQRFSNTDQLFSSTWPISFEQVFNESSISFDKIASALASYERSMVFVNNAWQDYLTGDNSALTEQQKQGAMLFFTPQNEGGAGCNACHNGPTFSDSRNHLVAFPQLGPGKGNNSGAGDSDDFGRENISGEAQDRYHFRTPTLLNIATSAPYGHAGAYQTLEEVVRHYVNPQGAISDLFAANNGEPFVRGGSDNAPICQLPQIADIGEKTNSDCEELLEGAYENSLAAVQHLQQARDGQVDARNIFNRNAQLNGGEVAQLVAFLQSLSDPCITNRECMSPWIMDAEDEASFPDDSLLVAEDENGDSL